MTTKIISFIFLIAFVITNVHCGTDAKDFFIPYRPESPDSDLSSEEEEENNQIGTPPTNSSSSSDDDNVYHPHYDHEEMIHIQETLIGRYQGIFMNQYTIIDIRTPNTLYIIRNGEERSYNYELIVERYGVCLVFTVDEIEHHRPIGISYSLGNHPKVIKIFTENNQVLDKIEDNANEINHHHDEH